MPDCDSAVRNMRSHRHLFETRFRGTAPRPAPLARLSLIGLLALGLLGCTDTPPEAPEVIVNGGTVRGIAEDSVLVFKNLPFAAAPVGKLRWRPPVPPPKWSGIRDGTTFGAVCPQQLEPDYSVEVLAQYPMTEDCLNLNVWTPSLAPDRLQPVMVWILPGSFKQGAGQMPRYNGAGLARQGQVVVTFNYRLGFLGQFAHPALTAAAAPDEPLANYGLMDQIAALKWVRDNIAAFGGDPDNVTIFGMSAGGVSVNYLMAMPAARGLFHRAISQSSAIRMYAPRRLSEAVPGISPLEQTGVQMADHFNIAAAEVLSGLRGLSWEQVLEFQAATPVAGGSLNPVLDGRLIVDSVGATFRDGRQAPVPYITGATSWEGSLLTFLDDATPVLNNLQMTRADADRLYGDADEKTLINKLQVDIFYGSQRYLAKLHAAAGQPTYLYFFSRVLEVAEDELPGAAHGAETRYAMQTLDSFAGPAKMAVYGTTISPSDRSYADVVSAYWAEFARTGNPNGADRPAWPRFDANPDAGDSLLEFAQDVPVARENFLADRMKYFENHFDAGKL